MSSFSELREQKMQRAWFSCVGRWATLLLSSVLASLQEMVRACMMWIIFAGPTPSHIAFIMDGNRRFADRLHVDRRIGHSHGYDALLHTLKDCFDLHVKTVTLFAFSIDNFQRHPDEVSALMDLMQSKLETLTEKQGLASEYGIRVQILGDLRLLPEPARLAAEKAMAVTRQNSTVLLNLCICYTSTHEIVQAIQRTRNDFLAAWGVSCKQYGDSSHSTHPNEEGNHDSENGNKVLENGFHSMQGGDEQFTNCEHNYASNNCNGGNLDPTFHQSNRVHVNGNGCSRTSDEENFNEYEMSSEDEIVAESRMLSRDMRCSSLLNSDAYSIGLRNRNEKKAQVSDDSSFMDLPLHASCSSDMHLRTAACSDKVKNNGKCCEAAPVRNGCTQREDVVGEIEHGDFYNAHEVVGFSTGALRSSYQCLSNPESSGNSWCPLHRFYSQDSCEDEKKVQSLLTRNFDEPHDACNRILKAVKDCISEEEIEKNLYTYPCPHPDLLIRTSGETRLSNFLLWQTSFSHLAFCKVLWPEFSFRHLFFIILEYQRAYPSLLRKRQYYSLESWTHH